MKRVFKFRAWDSETKEMIYLDKERLALEPHDMNVYLILNNEGDDILMQWTGFTDSEGRDIYEGDVIRFDDATWEVYWDSGCGEWSRKSGDEDIQLSDYPYLSRVIGNIYENSELIEDE